MCAQQRTGLDGIRQHSTCRRKASEFLQNLSRVDDVKNVGLRMIATITAIIMIAAKFSATFTIIRKLLYNDCSDRCDNREMWKLGVAGIAALFL